jgi:uncharacterized RDD family membrane protein YckC
MSAIQPLPVTASIAAYASHPYGGFWIRLLAWIIDAIVVGIAVTPIALALGTDAWLAAASAGIPLVGVHLVRLLTRLALQIAAVWLYEALMTSSSKQATLGKMALGLRVTDTAGNRIDVGRATLRVIAKFLSSAILFIGYIMIAFSDKKQGLHDLIAGTLVQKTR